MDGLFGGNAGAGFLAQLLSALSSQSAGYGGPQEPLTPFANPPSNGGTYGIPQEPLTPFTNPTTPSSGPTPGAPQSLTPGHPTLPKLSPFTSPYYMSAVGDGYTNSGLLAPGLGGMMWGQSPFGVTGGQSPFAFQSPFDTGGAVQHHFAFQSPFVNRNAMNGMHNNAVMAMLRGF